MKWYNYFVKPGVSLKVKLHLPYDPATSILGIFPREVNIYVHTKTCTQIFLAALYTIGHTQMSINIWMGKEIVVQYICSIYSRIPLRNNKERTININNRHESQNNNAEWNKSDKIEYLLYDSIYKRIPENATWSVESESRSVVAWGGSEGEWNKKGGNLGVGEEVIETSII